MDEAEEIGMRGTVVSLDRGMRPGGITAALEAGAFELWFQPKVQLDTGCLKGAEVLLRCRRPDGSIATPDTFIGQAEATGEIVPLGLWVAREACLRLALWRAGGLEDMTLAVNLSGRQASEQDLVGQIAGILEETGVPPHAVDMEFTESWKFSTQHIEALYALKALGVRLSVDDFGTGYSSLQALTELPLDTVKIDRHFIQRMSLCAHGLKLLQSMIDLAVKLGLDVVCEGIEHEKEVRALNRLQDGLIGQGYLFGKPMPLETFEIWMDGYTRSVRAGATACGASRVALRA